MYLVKRVATSQSVEWSSQVGDNSRSRNQEALIIAAVYVCDITLLKQAEPIRKQFLHHFV